MTEPTTGPHPPHPGAPGDGDLDQDGDQPRSGLKNPVRAVRAVAMATLYVECLVVLLAIQPIRMVAPNTPGWKLGVVAAVALACVGAAMLLHLRWGWHVGTAVQMAVTLTGVLQPALFVLGILFLAVWLYTLHLRRVVTSAGPPPAEAG